MNYVHKCDFYTRGVVCDDIDVFVLLVHKCKGNNAATMIMSSPAKDRSVVDIHATAEAHSVIAYELLIFMVYLVQIP